MILMYHKVFIETPTMWWVSVNDFYRQMVELQSKKIVYLDDYDSSDPKHVVITFDGVYRNILTHAAPIMKKFNYPFELFITSDYIGKKNEFDTTEPIAEFASISDLKILQDLGGRIQWHTRSHPDMSEMNDILKIRYELSATTELTKTFGKSGLKWFAYPYGRFNDLTLKATQEYFSGSLSCNQGNDENKFCLNRITVTNSTTMVDKTLSAIIASHNYGAYLHEAIESVLDQTIQASEILIIDDASEDNTPEIAEYYRNIYPGLIKYIRNEVNLGIVNCFNKAVANVKGDYLVFLGADNRFLSNYFESCLVEFYRNKSVGIVYTDYALFGSRAGIEYRKFNEAYRGEIKQDIYYIINFPEFDDPKDAMHEMESRNFIHGSSMYLRDAFNRVGGYLSKVGRPEDFDLFKRIIKEGYAVKKARGTYLEYRQHSKSQANVRAQLESKLTFYLAKSKSLERENEYLRRFEKIFFIGFLEKMYLNYQRVKYHGSEFGFFSVVRKIVIRLTSR